MNSDTILDITVFQTISQFNNSDVEIPNEFADSEPSPSTYTQTNSSTFSKLPFRPIQPQNQCTSPYTPSHITPFFNERSINNSPDNIQISEDLDNFITTVIFSAHSHYSPTIINNNIIKSTNTYTNFRLYSIISSIIHINRNIH